MLWFAVSSVIGQFIALGIKQNPYQLIADAFLEPLSFLFVVAWMSTISVVIAVVGHRHLIHHSVVPGFGFIRIVCGLVFGLALVSSDTVVELLLIRTKSNHGFLFVSQVAFAVLASVCCELCWRRIRGKLSLPTTNQAMDAEPRSQVF